MTRRPFRDFPLKHKLMLVITLTSVLALALACAVFFAFESAADRGRMARALALRADILGANSTAALTFGDPKAAGETLATMKLDPHILAARLYAKDGRLFAVYAHAGEKEGPSASPGADGLLFTRGRLTVVRGVFLAGERIGTISLAHDLWELYNSLAAFTCIAFVILLGSSITALALAARFQKVVSEPILELTRTAKAITSRGDYSARALKRGSDELGALVDDFNEMLGQIHKRDEALRESRQRLALLVESTPLGVIVWDLDFRVLEWNKSAEKIFGYAPAEAVGRHAAFIIPENWRAGVDKVWDALLAQRGGIRSTNENLAKDGRTIICQWYNATLIDSAGEAIAISSLVEDITERVRAEQEIAQLNAELERRVTDRTAKLEAANKELETFSYSVSHDLRAPLRAIDGFSLSVLEDYGDKLDEHGRDYLRRVRAATLRMGQIIDDMLTLGRVTRGELRHELVDLSLIAAEAVSELKGTQPDRRVSCEIDDGAQAWGDPHLLRLMLDNLLGNAWKFTSNTPGARVEFRVLDRDGSPAYLVRDNGVGFDSADAKKIFQPFIRLHAVAEFPGTGVGLAIVIRIVERHGGRIWAEGTPGKGASFFFTLARLKL